MAIQTKLFIWFFPLLMISVTIEILALYLSWDLEILAPQNALKMIFLSLAVISALASVSIYFVSSHISKPVQELNKAAMEIASGNFGETIRIKGPKEINELAQTFNTMSQCLNEQMDRLKDTTSLRDRLYAEHECTKLLQDQILQKAVSRFTHPNLEARLIKVSSPVISLGCLFDYREKENSLVFTEAKERGFQGVYDLLSDRSDIEGKGYLYSKVEFSSDFVQISCTCRELSLPIAWSKQQGCFLNAEHNFTSIEGGGFIFFCNQAFVEQFSRRGQMEGWFLKVLRHFASENFDSLAAVLSNELNFLSHKKHIADDLYILAVKVQQFPVKF